MLPERDQVLTPLKEQLGSAQVTMKAGKVNGCRDVSVLVSGEKI